MKARRVSVEPAIRGRRAEVELEIVALRRLSAAAFGLLMSLEPAVAALAGVIVLSQRLTGVLIAALVMVVTASVGTTIAGRSAVGAVRDEPQVSA